MARAEPKTYEVEPQEARPAQVTEEVAVLAKVFTPEKYGMLPTVAGEEVESPLKPRVAPERVIGQVALIVACLLLKVVQSVPERRPLTEAVEFGILKVKVPPVLVIPQSFAMAVVEVARVMAPVTAEPLV